MGKERPGIILLRRNAEAIAEMSVEEAGLLIKAVFAFDAGEEIPELSPFARAVFCGIRADLKQHAQHYQDIVDTNRRNAQKRWGDKGDDAAAGPSDAVACARMIRMRIMRKMRIMRNMPREGKRGEGKRRYIYKFCCPGCGRMQSHEPGRL